MNLRTEQAPYLSAVLELPFPRPADSLTLPYASSLVSSPTLDTTYSLVPTPDTDLLTASLPSPTFSWLPSTTSVI